MHKDECFSGNFRFLKKDCILIELKKYVPLASEDMGTRPHACIFLMQYHQENINTSMRRNPNLLHLQ